MMCTRAPARLDTRVGEVLGGEGVNDAGLEGAARAASSGGR